MGFALFSLVDELTALTLEPLMSVPCQNQSAVPIDDRNEYLIGYPVTDRLPSFCHYHKCDVVTESKVTKKKRIFGRFPSQFRGTFAQLMPEPEFLLERLQQNVETVDGSCNFYFHILGIFL